jgi:hypothetical protein
LKEETEKTSANELAMVIKGPNRANLASELQFVQEKDKGNLALVYNEVDAEKKMASKNGARIFKPQVTCLQRNTATASCFPPRSTLSAMSVPPQLLLLPSPTSPLPPPCPAFFYQGLLDNQYQNQTQARAQCQSLHPAPQPSAGYHASPVCTTFPHSAYLIATFLLLFVISFFVQASASSEEIDISTSELMSFRKVHLKH